jgi:hypothetical protein
MDNKEPLNKLVRRLEMYIFNLVPVRNLNTLSRDERKLIQTVTQNISLARGQIEFSLGDEDFDARKKGFMLAHEQLEAVNEGILGASMRGLIDTIEVSQLSAMTELCIDRIKQLA